MKMEKQKENIMDGGNVGGKKPYEKNYQSKIVLLFIRFCLCDIINDQGLDVNLSHVGCVC